MKVIIKGYADWRHAKMFPQGGLINRAALNLKKKGNCFIYDPYIVNIPGEVVLANSATDVVRINICW